MTRLAVIGGGIIGMLTARELAQRGFAVTVYERGRVGAEASWAGAGVLSPMPPWHYPRPVQDLARASQVLYPGLAAQLLADTGIDPQWTQSGLLVLDGDARAAAAWAQRATARVEELDVAAVHALEPALAPRRALRLADVAHIRNPRLLRALHADLVRRAVQVREQTPVEALDTAGTRVRCVRTAAGRVDCDGVVIAAGAWSGHLLEGHWRPAVSPVRGQMLVFETPAGLVGHVVLAPDGHYLVPRRDGRILVGSSVEHAGFDRGVTPAVRATLAGAAAELLPVLRTQNPVAQWAGLRPFTPTGVPIIGQHPDIENLWLATGHYRNGLTLAPATATLLADLICGTPPGMDAAPYRPGGMPGL